MSEKTIDELKKSLDIVTVAENYGELVKSGANFIYKNDKSIVINPAKQIFSDFNGTITGGSVLDLIMMMEKIWTPPATPTQEQIKEGIKKLKEFNGVDTYTINPALQIKRKKEEEKTKKVDFQKLGYIGMKEIEAVGYRKPVLIQDEYNKPIGYNLSTEYQKLFETMLLPADAKAKIDYLYTHILGWNDFFKCPSIIIRDSKNKIVDIISYRPVKPESYDNWTDPKYIYKNSHNRGKDFLFPFRKEFEAILFKQVKDRYFIVGEGIKNGLNALLYSVPYITLESSSNKISDTLIAYIQDLVNRGFSLITMFDGDQAGAKAFYKFKEQTKLECKNFLDFNSGLDFVDYLQSEDNNG